MSLKSKYDHIEDLDSLLDFKSEKEELKHEAYMLMFKFLSELERVTEQTIKKRDLAEALDSSRSFISQLFSGEKLANLTTIAKLQKAYDLTFEIKAKLNKANSVFDFTAWVSQNATSGTLIGTNGNLIEKSVKQSTVIPKYPSKAA